MKRIGIYGGSFSPPHNGHIAAARHLLKALSLDELLIMPSYISPHKQTSGIVSAYHRYEMTRLAFQNMPKITISDYEISRGDISYTANTLTHFKEQGQLFFLCGTDMFLSLSRWYRPDAVFQNATVVVASREDGMADRIQAAKSSYEKEFAANIVVLHNKVLPLSSTEIRQMLSKGKDVSALIPPTVEVYIREHNLYV